MYTSLATRFGHTALFGFFITLALLASATFSHIALANEDQGNHEDEHHAAATIVATKIVCASEADLPNWGNGGSDITASTAADYVAAHPNCHLQSGWTFQWAPSGSTHHPTVNPGDNATTPAGSPWTSFGPTNASGVATAQMLVGDDEDSHVSVWVREVLKDGYVPFSGWIKSGNSTPSTNDAVSAELYCGHDVLNYDNFDKIATIHEDREEHKNRTYYCVAFNALKTGTVTIIKNVNNTAGGSKVAGDFTFSIPGATPATVTGSETGVETVLPGNATYTVTEDQANQNNYATIYSTDCTGTVLPGAEKVCTVTNTYVRPAPQCDENAETTVVSDTADQVDAHGSTVISSIQGILPGVWATIPGANWIWSSDGSTDDTTVDKTEVFSKTFTLAGSITTASLDLSADNGYLVKVNGTTVDDQSAVETNYSSVHHYDITSDVHTGSNTIEVTVKNFALGGSTFANNPGGLIYKIDVHANTCNQGNQCITPNHENAGSLVFGSSSEPTLQTILTNASYVLNALTDQKDTTSWTAAGGTVNFTAKFIKRYAGNDTVFGYFANGASTFTPVFTEGSRPDFPTTPVLVDGASQTFSVPTLSSIIFAINTKGGVIKTFTTDPASANNTDVGDQHAVVYHPSANEYVMGFEDVSLSGADKDYNDLTASVTATSCTPAETPTTATVQAQKIVCPTESELPNWGAAGGPDITATTASDFLAAHTDCHLADWTFEYAPDSTSNPGDNAGIAGGAWVPFTTTGVSKIASATIPAGALTWVREQMQSNYIPFSGIGGSDVSAEMYCNTDHRNYDNYDWINPVAAGKTYYCVAWNVPTSTEQPPQDPTCNPETQHLDNHVCVDNPTTGGGTPPTCDGDHHLSGGQCVPNDGPNNNGGPGNGPLILGASNNGGGNGGLILGASCGLTMNQHLRYGSKKNDPEQVKILQGLLNKYLPGLNLPVTGVFDKATEAAVKAFQAKYGSNILKPWGLGTPTGLVYLTTLYWINHLECPDLTDQLPSNLVPWSLGAHQ